METCQELLQTKIGAIAVLDPMQKTGKRLLLQVQVTLQESVGAALTTLELLDLDILGMNCATDPAEINAAVRYLGANSSREFSILPNAGLPQNEGGHAVYKLVQKSWPNTIQHYVQDYGVRIVGGYCGTTPEHLKAVIDAVANVEPAKREVKPQPQAAAASAYISVLDLDPKPLVVAD